MDGYPFIVTTSLLVCVFALSSELITTDIIHDDFNPLDFGNRALVIIASIYLHLSDGQDHKAV